MDLSTLLKDYGAFNFWANSHLVEWLLEKPAGLLEQETPSSFPTLKGTLLHIWSAEDIWLNRLKGVSPTRFLAADFTGTTAELFEGLLHRSAEFRDFLSTQDARFFENKTAYTHTSGVTYSQTNAEIILHCLQHSTFHRGQIITMARSLGLTDVPHTDYILYARQRALPPPL
jgi:uncharacterized damage-inducible protein DinB